MDCKCGHAITFHTVSGCVLCACENPSALLVPEIPHDRERALYYGDAGAGKTVAALSWANVFRNDTFHYIRADRDPEKLFKHFPSHDFFNLIQYPAYTYEEMMAAMRQIVGLIRSDADQTQHWVIYDTITMIYQRSRDSYTLAKYGKAFEEVYIERTMAQHGGPQTQASKDGKGYAGGMDPWEWDIIRTRFYGNFINPVLHNSQANMILLAQAVPIGDATGPNGRVYSRTEPNGSAGVQGRFNAVGQLPEVHHKMTSQMDTVLHFGILAAKHEHQFYTIKDTGRLWTEAPTAFRNFAVDYSYLVKDHADQTLG